MVKYGAVIFIMCVSIFSIGQSHIKITNLHFKEYFDSNSFSIDKAIHTSVKPYYSLQEIPSQSSLFNQVVKKEYDISIYPLANLGIGYDNITGGVVNAGVGFGVDFNAKRWGITVKTLPYYNQPNYIEDSIQSNYSVDLGTSRSILKKTYHQSEIIALFKPNRFFTFMGGYGKNSFGEGYRSLILSDHAAANPFFKLETQFWSIKYVNLYNVWKDFYASPSDKSKDITKLSAMHYLSWNITKRFNLSVFETVIWQAKDSLTNRYFEPNYINPFVFYRPVEYAQGSSDNVLIGLNMSYKLNQKSVVYYQLILDEFLLSELRARSQWWANKYGMQLGVKTPSLLIPNLYAQLEFNLGKTLYVFAQTKRAKLWPC